MSLAIAFSGLGLVFVRATILSESMTENVEPHGHCFKCGYNLNYSVSDRCSECGAPVSAIMDAITKWKGHSESSDSDT